MPSMRNIIVGSITLLGSSLLVNGEFKEETINGIAQQAYKIEAVDFQTFDEVKVNTEGGDAVPASLINTQSHISYFQTGEVVTYPIDFEDGTYRFVAGTAAKDLQARKLTVRLLDATNTSMVILDEYKIDLLSSKDWQQYIPSFGYPVSIPAGMYIMEVTCATQEEEGATKSVYTNLGWIAAVETKDYTVTDEDGLVHVTVEAEDFTSVEGESEFDNKGGFYRGDNGADICQNDDDLLNYHLCYITPLESYTYAVLLSSGSYSFSLMAAAEGEASLDVVIEGSTYPITVEPSGWTSFNQYSVGQSIDITAGDDGVSRDVIVVFNNVVAANIDSFKFVSNEAVVVTNPTQVEPTEEEGPTSTFIVEPTTVVEPTTEAPTNTNTTTSEAPNTSNITTTEAPNTSNSTTTEEPTTTSSTVILPSSTTTTVEESTTTVAEPTTTTTGIRTSTTVPIVLEAVVDDDDKDPDDSATSFTTSFVLQVACIAAAVMML